MTDNEFKEACLRSIVVWAKMEENLKNIFQEKEETEDYSYNDMARENGTIHNRDGKA